MKITLSHKAIIILSIIFFLSVPQTYAKYFPSPVSDTLTHPANLTPTTVIKQNNSNKDHSYKLTFRYKNDQFDKTFTPWNEWSASIESKNSWGTIIGQANDAHRFSHNAAQIEIDAYPVFRKGTYAYLNSGLSNGTIYPDYRFGISIYQSIPGNLILGLGVRSMKFSPQNVFLLTGTVSLYLPHYYLAIHPYIDPNKKNQSFMCLVRRYLSNSQNYIQVMVGDGSTPFGFNTNQDLNRLNSRSLLFLLQKELSRLFSLEVSTGYEREEYIPGKYRHRYHSELAFSYHF